MHPGARGARDQVAQDRIVQAAKVLAARFGCHEQSAALVTVQAHDPLVRAMLQRERVADLLEALVTATEPNAKTGDGPATDARRGRRKAE